MKKRVYFFIGTTAELIKLAPIIKEFQNRHVPYKIITSGQTRVLFENLKDYYGDITPDISLRQKSEKSSILFFGWWAVNSFLSAVFGLRKEFKGLNKNNSYFIVHGDTVSSLIGALVASIYKLKLVHVESGLRSFNFIEPFPEEICRFIISHIASIRFASTPWALNNIKHLPGINIHTKENTLVESCLWALKTKGGVNPRKKFGKYYILTMHRQEHVFFKKNWTIDTIKYVINNAPQNLKCVLVTHHLTESFIENKRFKNKAWKNVTILPRVPYVDFMKMMDNAEFIATDGCTNQEEAYYMGLPLLALRNRTERIEGLNENIVLSYSKNKIIRNFLTNYKTYKRKPIKIKVKPSKMITNLLFS